MRVLITGGAGFIGSNLVKFLLGQENVDEVRVMDNLATGYRKNLAEFETNPKFRFLNGDIRLAKDCEEAVKGVTHISHQAALGSVPRSIEDPFTSHDVNVNGFINILEAARKEGIQTIAYASSSAVYGDSELSPKKEEVTGKLLSPYAATKMANELYAEVYSKNYNMTLTGFRYFNVFGPKQDPTGAYAAVIPIFISHALKGQAPIINGDGTITRDFTPVSNVVLANWLALTKNCSEGHYVYNVACGDSTSLLNLWELISEIVGSPRENVIFGPVRKGDILFSLADIKAIKEDLGYEEDSDLKNALKSAVDYYKQSIQ
ncbi:MAG TPA: LPS biosynthesis protein WbpP [Bacteroidetes bacterium]|jgi:UDP-N-acetylglucosamine/UDP-N-acetylgalactosamine 4-epimerase|nr:MAG: hypothetical protein ABR95_11695 [Sphingobacteriales bacterium BACL12 MAG-120813-bin55]HCK21858.1 LPS biosynthesis protein WbpP [Bacteroidota bacterium]